MKKITLLMLLLLVYACKEANDEEPPPCTQEVPLYESCCETEAIVAMVGEGPIYIPNIFTPNADGINDYFFVFGGAGVDRIKRMVVKNRLGEEVFNAVEVAPNDVTKSWDGTKDGVVLTGVFDYEVEVESVLGERETFIGEVCSFVCDGGSDLIAKAHTPKCRSAVQTDGNGGLDTNLSILDFENPDCFEQ